MSQNELVTKIESLNEWEALMQKAKEQAEARRRHQKSGKAAAYPGAGHRQGGGTHCRAGCPDGDQCLRLSEAAIPQRGQGSRPGGTGRTV